MALAQTLLVAVVVSILAPAVLHWLSSRTRRQEKAEEYRRQDLVAARVADAAAQAEEAAALLVADNKRVAARTALTDDRMFGDIDYLKSQLDRIHVLVNSNLTEAQERERDATVAMLATMREVLDLKRRAGIDPTPETLAVIQRVEARIEAQNASLAHKREQTAIADARANDIA